MIKEDYVSFEVAQLLKERGFDESCHLQYKENGIYVVHTESPTYNSLLGDNDCVGPTQSITMKWLREKHKLYIDVSLIEYQNKSKWCHKIVPIDEPHISYNNCMGDSYEQSCEEAIKYCLRNLI